MNDDRFSLEDFELYRLARSFRMKIYQLSKELPASERFELASQMRRAALSISNNVAEGHGRWFYLDDARFCRITRGSIEEIIDDLNVCLDEKYFPPERITLLKSEAQSLIKRVNGYISYLKRSLQGKDEFNPEPKPKPSTPDT